MKRFYFIVSLCLSLFLVGCTTTHLQDSYVSPLTPNDVTVISHSITDFLSTQFPPASNTLLLVPPVQGQNNAMTSALTQTLTQAGFAIGNSNQVDPRAHRLQYWITPLEQGVLVRLMFDSSIASCFYSRDASGSLHANSPFTIRK